MAFKRTIRGKESAFYYVDFWIGQKGDPRAIHVNKSTKKDNLKAALELENQWKADAEEQYFKSNGAGFNNDDVLFSDALKLTWKKQWQHTKAGERPYARLQKIISLTGDIPISELFGSKGALLVDDVREALIDEKERSKQTIDMYMANFRTCLNVTKRKMQLKDLAVPEFDMFNKPHHRTRTMSRAEELELFRLMDKYDPHYAMLFKVLLDTGLRVSEGLKISYRKHIFLDQRRIMLMEDGVKMSIKNGKARAVPMTKRVHDILVKLKETHPDRPFPFKQTYMSHLFRKYRNMMGLHDDKEFVPHMLRHTCTTRLIVLGVTPPIVQQWLGHSDAKMTTHYTQLNVEHMREGAEMLDKVHETMYSISPEGSPSHDNPITGT